MNKNTPDTFISISLLFETYSFETSSFHRLFWFEWLIIIDLSLLIVRVKTLNEAYQKKMNSTMTATATPPQTKSTTKESNIENSDNNVKSEL